MGIAPDKSWEFRNALVGSGGMMNRRAMSNFVKNPVKVAATLEKIFEDDLHARRVLSLANGVVGVLDAAALSIHAIGRGYAHATGMNDKHGVKQTDRLLSNPGIDMWMLFSPWVEFVVAARTELVVALDWTEFDADDHATLAAYLVTSHGRATPLIWMTVTKSTLEGKRNDYEYRLIERLHECVAADVAITVLADRGFGDQKLYGLLQTLGWDFVIRFRGLIQVEDADGVRKPAAKWLPATGRATMIRGARRPHTRAPGPPRRRRPRTTDEGAVVSGNDAEQRQGHRGGEALRSPVHDRRDVSRPEESSLRAGIILNAHWPHGSSRPPAVPRGNRASAADLARRSRRSRRPRSLDEDQHIEEAHDVVVQPRHESLRRDSEHARGATRAPRDSVRLGGPSAPRFPASVRCDLRGWLSRLAPGGETIVLIAVSGYGSSDDKRTALAAGFDAHLTKPFNPDEITKILNELEQFRRNQT
jgi:hypothetical protein